MSLSGTGNVANYNVNLENKLVARINAANSTIDMAVYELTLPGVVQALLDAVSLRGVTIRGGSSIS